LNDQGATNTNERLYRRAFALAVFTIVYNVVEGVVAVGFGYRDESLTLFGFGLDSFIEVLSGVGIAHMVLRIQRHPSSDRDGFEKLALRVTGFAFYGLVAGLLATGAYKIVSGDRPETTLVGVIVSLVSIAVMLALLSAKQKVGTALRSAPIIADAHCTRVCIYMSLVLLGASAVYELTHIAYVDIAGSLALAYLSFTEGRECFSKARGEASCACDPADPR
jgi:divalent metal cation (Fe/Co/Zn/Cd) transporter